MAMISFNGVKYQGNSITITNGKVIVDGKDVTPDTKEINISVDGNIEKLKVDQCVKVSVNGACGSVETMSGNVNCGPVNGPVKTMSGGVKCERVGGDVETMSGDVECGVIAGSVDTQSGDIDHVKIGEDDDFMKFVATHAPNLIEEYERTVKAKV